MLKVKSKDGLSIQGTGRRHVFREGDIVPDEIFVKDFQKDDGKIILRGFISDKVIEVVKDKAGKAEKALEELNKKELIALAKEKEIEVNDKETIEVILAVVKEALEKGKE